MLSSALAADAAKRTNFPAEIREMAMAHFAAIKVEAPYRRGDLFDERRHLAHEWERLEGRGATAEGTPASGRGGIAADQPEPAERPAPWPARRFAP